MVAGHSTPLKATHSQRQNPYQRVVRQVAVACRPLPLIRRTIMVAYKPTRQTVQMSRLGRSNL